MYVGVVVKAGQVRWDGGTSDRRGQVRTVQGKVSKVAEVAEARGVAAFDRRPFAARLPLARHLRLRAKDQRRSGTSQTRQILPDL